MSLLDGRATLDDWRGGGRRNNGNNGNNGGGKKNRNDRQPNRRDSRNFSGKGSGYNFFKSSYMTDEARLDNEPDEQEDAPVERRDQRAEDIYAFIEDFKDVSDDFRQLRDLVIDRFPDVVKHVRSYYSQKNGASFNDAVNKLIAIISTSQFANVLSNVLEKGEWNDDNVYDRCWYSIAFALSTALETSVNRMNGRVVRKYASEILPRMWDPEITEVVTQTGVTKDLALDLFIALPISGGEWNSSNLNEFYSRFLDKMLIHAEDNMDVLNWEVQGMLYKRFFGDSKDALRVIGKYLTMKPLEKLDSEVEQAVYKDFIKMLYSKLDEYDINDISYVFRYVASTRKATDNAPTIFNSKEAAAYDNVKKGLIQVMDKDPDTMNYLA